MVMSLRELAERCFSLRGSFSVLRNLFGYVGNNVPGMTSLIQELRQLRDNEHITIHIKIMSTPTSPFIPRVSIDEMIFSMRQIYNNANIGIVVGSRENLTLENTDINVDECKPGQVTDEHVTLFNNRNFVGQNEIVVYFVRAVITQMGMVNGCATFPADRPGVIIARIADRRTLAHEVGHVFVGPHIEQANGQTCPANLTPQQLDLCQLDNIMTCCGTFMIPDNIVPVFNSDQIQQITDSGLTRQCGA